MFKGIFWVISNKLQVTKVACNLSGIPLENADFSSKSGNNLNNKKEWEKTNLKIPYNYYPRGRVEIKNAKAIVYLNSTINTLEFQNLIKNEFGLQEIKTVFKSDGSKHYTATMNL